MRLIPLICLIFCMGCLISFCPAQDSTQKNIFQWNGYLKDLNVISFPNKLQPLKFENIIHNRFNLDWQSNRWKAGAALRNRFFWNNNQFKSSLERLWVEYRNERLNIKAGRQRINWGMNNSWNPNDIFNTYNLFDFDFEERSGIDGLMMHDRFSSSSSLDLAWKPHYTSYKNIIAVKYNRHIGSYDWQLIGGFFNGRPTIGTGWQGSMGNTGFKGEIQYFSKDPFSPSRLNASIEWDFISTKGWYWTGSLLFNQRGLHEHPGNWEALNFSNTADKLMPTRWNTLIALRKEITPIISASMHVLHAPLTGLWIFYPTGSFNLMSNLSLDLVWQGFWVHRHKGFISIQHIGFIRLKYSF